MEAKRCKRCIMPTEYPSITFDGEGICSFCANGNSNTEKNKTDLLGKEKLMEIIRSAGRNGEYDCVIPLSGGKDSTYVLYYVVKELGLKPIAVRYNSGFQTEIASENVKNACAALNVPCVIEEADRKIQNRLLRDSLRISQILGSFVLTCLNCGTIIRAIPIKVAKQKGIPFVLFGDSVRESVRLMMVKSKVKNATYEEVRSNSLFTSLAETILQLRAVNMTPIKFMRIFPRLVRYRLVTVRQFLSLGLPFMNAMFPNLSSVVRKSGPQMIHFYDYIDWNPVKDLAILEKELKWKHPPNRKSRFDCSLNCFGSYDALQKGHISKNGIIACNLIREGLISREEALKAEQCLEQTVVEQCKKILSELDLDNFVLR